MYEWCETYAKSLKFVSTEYKVEWEAVRLLVGEKSFGMIGTDNHKRPIITLKLKPSTGEMLRELYPEKIVPGYYSNKVHWNSFYLDSDLDESLIKEYIEISRNTLIESFSKKKQQEFKIKYENVKDDI